MLVSLAITLRMMNVKRRQTLITELNPLFNFLEELVVPALNSFIKPIDRILYGLGGVGNSHGMLGEDENKLVTSRRKIIFDLLMYSP